MSWRSRMVRRGRRDQDGNPPGPPQPPVAVKRPDAPKLPGRRSVPPRPLRRDDGG